MMFLGWIIIGVILFYILKDKKGFNKTSDAEELLKQRFINGEIDEDSYLRMKKLI